MTNSIACPSPRDLQRLVLGQLAEAEASQLGEHILSCSTCGERFSTLCSDVSVGESSPSLADKPTAHALLERLLRRTRTASATPIGSTDVAPDASPMPPQIGRYHVVGRLGAGGMGVVYRAHDPQLQRDVAIKMPTFRGSDEACAAARQRFLREARAAAAVRHPHICPIHDVGAEADRPFVVMALVEGESLAGRLRREGRFENPRQAVALLVSVADALAVVHAQHIVHRDLKPGNILLDRAGQPYLSDFGLARAEDNEPLTSTGQFMGTPAYMAPEQAAPDLGPIDVWSDQYSLAVVLYQMLTGRLPFQGPATALIFQIGSLPAPAPSEFRPDLDPALERVLMKALARKPQDRYASVADFAHALRGWSEATAATENAVHAATTMKMPVTEPTQKRRSFALVACALVASLGLVLAAGGVAYQLFFRTSDGTLVVEVAPDADLRFRDGELHIFDDKGKKIYTLKPSDKNKKLPPGDYLIEIAGAEGLKLDTKEFEITKNGERKVRVTLAPPAVAQKGNPTPTPKQLDDKKPPTVAAPDNNERAVAEWVIATGGSVAYYKKAGPPSGFMATKKEDLPNEPAVLYGVSWSDGKEITDDDLKSLQAMTGLNTVLLHHSKVTGAGLKHLKALANLDTLDLRNNSRLSAAELVSLKDLTTVRNLGFANTKVGSPVLEHLKNMSRLRILNLTDTKVNDDGLKHLYGLRQLEILVVSKTSVSGAGLAGLHKALPKCAITWDGGTIKPNPPGPDPEPRANGPLIFEDAFDGKTPEPKLLFPALTTFTRADGGARLAGNSAGILPAIYPDDKLKDFAIEFTMRVPRGNPKGSHGVLLRCRKEGNELKSYYHVSFDLHAHAANFALWHEGRYMPLKTQFWYAEFDKDLAVRLEFVDKQIRAFVNKEFVGEAEDDTLPGPGLLCLSLNCATAEPTAAHYQRLRVFKAE